MQPACREDAGCGFKGASVMANPEHVEVVMQRMKQYKDGKGKTTEKFHAR
jgi:hypothetical protein